MSTTTSAELSDADKAAVASLTQRVVAAWAKHDADAFADVFIEDGTMVLPGLHKVGRAAIRDHMAAEFAGPYRNTQVTGKPIEMKRLGPDAAVLLSDGGVLQPGDSEVSRAEAIRAAWIAVKNDGQWLLAMYVNTPKDV
jgi:uncharacterized protein (TIGR02246 family)